MQRGKSEKHHLSNSIATNSIKYLQLTLTQEVKDLFDKNVKILKKEIGEDTRK